MTHVCVALHKVINENNFQVGKDTKLFSLLTRRLIIWRHVAVWVFFDCMYINIVHLSSVALVNNNDKTIRNDLLTWTDIDHFIAVIFFLAIWSILWFVLDNISLIRTTSRLVIKILRFELHRKHSTFHENEMPNYTIHSHFSSLPYHHGDSITLRSPDSRHLYPFTTSE